VQVIPIKFCYFIAEKIAIKSACVNMPPKEVQSIGIKCGDAVIVGVAN